MSEWREPGALKATELADDAPDADRLLVYLREGPLPRRRRFGVAELPPMQAAWDLQWSDHSRVVRALAELAERGLVHWDCGRHAVLVPALFVENVRTAAQLRQAVEYAIRLDRTRSPLCAPLVVLIRAHGRRGEFYERYPDLEIPDPASWEGRPVT